MNCDKNLTCTIQNKNALYSNSFFEALDAYIIHKPLVVVVVIGDYKQSPLPSIKGAANDYCNVVRSFNCIRGYDVAFATNDGIKHLTNKNRVTNTNEIKSFDFKLKWFGDDIENFNEHIAQKILSSPNKQAGSYDSLIYILSSHGDADETIYCSNGDELPLEFIDDKFNNKNCKSLRQRPKIYMFDIGQFPGDSHTKQTPNLQLNNYHNDKRLHVNKDQSKKATSSVPVLDTKTYTEHSHCCTIFGNSKRQPLRFINSLFISGISNVVSDSSMFDNSSLGDVLFETRQAMANALSSPNRRVVLDEIVLNEQNTMPYDIKFSSSTTIESKTDVCALSSSLYVFLLFCISF